MVVVLRLVVVMVVVLVAPRAASQGATRANRLAPSGGSGQYGVGGPSPMATTERRVATQLHLPLLWRTSSLVISMQCHAVHPTNSELVVSMTALKDPTQTEESALATRTW